jgi:hypothetical protein
MNKLKFICFGIVFLYLPDFWCQSWKSISKINAYEIEPYRQFKIDPYRNSIWFVQDLKVSVIENSGTIHKFTSTELGELWSNDKLKFVFTPSNIFYNINVFGFHSFTNYSSVLVDSSFCDYLNMTNNNDTVFITMANQTGFRKFADNTSEIFNKNYTEINAKGQFIYGNNGSSVIYKYEPITNTSTILNSDPQYLWTIFHDTKFSRHSDTLYVAGKKGISFAFNYDFLDTITPNNTSNMPSPNVLEIEFDHEDKLWAVFGDASDVPFSLAKLEGSTWVHQYDANNSPIDFNNYLGMEIDTLGNVWVVDNMNLHTLLTESSPAWLSTVELKPTATFSLQPNPTNDFIELTTEKPTGAYQLLDAQGRIIITEKIHSSQQLIDLSNLQSGVYFIAIDENVKRFVKQ